MICTHKLKTNICANFQIHYTENLLFKSLYEQKFSLTVIAMYYPKFLTTKNVIWANKKKLKKPYCDMECVKYIRNYLFTAH